MSNDLPLRFDRAVPAAMSDQVVSRTEEPGGLLESEQVDK